MMVRYPAVIDKRSRGLDRFCHKLCGPLLVWAHTHGFQTLFYGICHVGSQISGIRPRISQDLVVLIETLHQIQRLLGRKSESFVCVSLKVCQIVEGRRIGFLRLF